MSGLFRALHRTKVFRNLTEQEFAWVLYDVGNSAFIMLACSLIPIWFKSLAIGTGPGKISSDQATAYYSIAISIVTVVVALIGPVCGVLADRKDKKKIFFTTTAGLGITGCVLNGVATSWVLFLVIYIVTRVCYNASLTIYDSMLNDVTTEERMDEVSSYGYAWGYLGSCIPFLVALIAYVLGPDMVRVLPDFVSKMIGFGVTALWWLVVTLPLLKEYRQKNYVEMRTVTVGQTFGKIFGTLKKIAVSDRKVFFFLIGFFLYIDGVGTIIDNCINIGTDLNLNTVGQVVFLLATQVVAFGGSLFFAKLSRKKRYGIPDSDLHRRLFCHLPLCADTADAGALCDSGIWSGMLSGINSVVVAVVLFQNYSGGEFGRIFWNLRYFCQGRFLPWICSHCSCKAGGRNDQRSGCMSGGFLCTWICFSENCRPSADGG